MNTVKIRDIEIGAGAPKIIVPIVGVQKTVRDRRVICREQPCWFLL